jgi:glycosyltransferase involved in cell wall biosynthesis
MNDLNGVDHRHGVDVLGEPNGPGSVDDENGADVLTGTEDPGPVSDLGGPKDLRDADDVGRANERWLPIKVQLCEPLHDVPMTGHTALHVTVMAGETPIGRVVVPCRAEVCSADRLRPYVQDFARQAVSIRMSERFERRSRTTPAVSVVVCTRNRADQLDGCLSALVALENVDAQIIVVDNGDDDGATKRTAKQCGVDYVTEPVAGLDRARNRGLTMARHELVLYTDDDVLVEPKWAYWLATAFDDPAVVAATGTILPAELETPGQVEFEVIAGFVRTLKGFTLDGSYTPPAAAGRAGAGASMAFRRDFIAGLGGFPEVLDGGRPTKSGGDTYGLYLALREGRRVRFEPRAIAHHRHRPTRADGLDTVAGYATGVVAYLTLAAINTKDPAAVFAAVKWTAWRTGLLVRHLVTRPRSIETRYIWAQVRGAFAAPRALLRAQRTNPASDVLDGPLPATITAAASRDRSTNTSDISTGRLPGPNELTVTVIIPTQGRRPGLAALIEELRLQHRQHDRRQSGPALEIIVATDGPFRDAAELGAAVGSEIDAVVVTGSGGGAGGARNRGARAASGDILLFLDDDMSIASNDLVSAHRVAHVRGHVAVVGPILPADHRPGSAGRPSALAMMERNWWSDQARHLSDGRQLDFTDLCSGNLSIRRETYLAIGGFVELPRREDYELGLRLINAGHEIGCALDAAVLHPSDGTVKGAMMRRRREGRADIALVEHHPCCVTKLDLWSWPDLSHRRRRLAHAAIDYPRLAFAAAGLAAHVAPVMDRLGSRRRLARVLDLVIDIAYWAGVGQATDGFAGWRRQSSRIVAALDSSPHDRLDLYDVDSWSPQQYGHHRVDVMWGEERLGVGDLRWGGLPFDRATFADRLASDLAVRVGTPPRRFDASLLPAT